MRTKFGFKLVTFLITFVLLFSGILPQGAKAGWAGQLSVHLKENAVFGFGWEYPGTAPTISVTDPNPGGTDLPATLMSSDGGYYSLNLNGIYTLKPGQVVTMTQDEAVKQITILPFSVDGINVDADTVFGTAAPNTTVAVYSAIPEDSEFRLAQPDAQGRWSVNFSVPSSEDSRIVDITDGMVGQAYIVDEDGDTVQETWYARTAFISANPASHWVMAYNWPTNTPVTIQIGNYSDNCMMQPTSWINHFFHCTFSLPAELDLVPGDIVTVTGGGITKQMAVMNFTITTLDVATNTIAGTAQPGGTIAFCDNPTAYCTNIDATSEQWSITPDRSEFTLTPGSYGWAAERVGDRNETHVGWYVPNPTFEVRAPNEVSGWGWVDGEKVTLAVNGVDIQDTTAGQTPWGPSPTYVYFNLAGQAEGIKVGDMVSLTSGDITKEIVVNLEITEVDVQADIVSGVATPNSELNVWACDINWSCPNRYILVGDSGRWSANFAVQSTEEGDWGTVDIVQGTWIDSRQADSDGDATLSGWTGPKPIISAYLSENRIETIGWKLGQDLNINITNSAGPDYIAQITPTPWQWDQSSGYANIELGLGFILEPGQVVTISNGDIAKSMTVMDLYVDAYDPLAKTVAGHVTPDTQVRVSVWDENGGERWASSTGGAWAVGFDTGTPAFIPWSSGDVTGWDASGNETKSRINMGSVYTWPDGDQIVRDGCTYGKWYTLTVEGTGKSYTDEQQCISEDGYIVTRFYLPSSGYLVAGDIITVESGHDVRTLVVTPRGQVSFVYGTSLVSGVNSLDTYIRVMPDGPWENGRTIKTGPDGSWSVDFSKVGDNGEPVVTINPGSGVGISEYDIVANNVGYGFGVPNPIFVVNPTAHWAYAWDWPADQDITLSVGDFTATVKNHATGPSSSEAYFDLTGVALDPGMLVSVAGAGINKSLELTNFTVNIDSSTNTLSGTASAQGNVTACAGNTPGDCRFATAVDGAWSMPPSQDSFTLAAGVFGWAAEGDADGDMTRMDWSVPNPRFDVRPNAGQVEAWEWTYGETLTLAINGVDIQEATVGICPWDANYTYAIFNLAADAIKVDDAVSVRNSEITKQTVVIDLEISDVDVQNDVVSGVAPANSELDVWACDFNGSCPNRHIHVDGSGIWSTNFAIESSAEGDWGTIDIVRNTWIDSRQADVDSDGTMFGLNVFYPFIIANPGANWVYGQDWPVGERVTLQIGDYSATVESSNPDKVAWFSLPEDIQLTPGTVVTLSGGKYTQTMIIRDMSITKFDVIHDSISGIATSNAQMFVCAYDDPSGCLSLSAGPDGSWTYTFDGLTYDLKPGLMGFASVADEMGNNTGVDWQVPMPTSGSAVEEGWFASPAGAYMADPAFAGKAAIQFDAKYGKKSATLSGSVQFTFKHFSFASTSLDWLAVDGGRMQLSGQGKVNGTTGYSFMLSAAVNPPGLNGSDTVHIRIWETATGNVIYDNMPGVLDYVLPTTVLQGGELILTP